MKKLKVLYYGNCNPVTSMGILHRDAKNILEKNYNILFDIMDFSSKTYTIFNSTIFWKNEVWKAYDIIMCDPSLALSKYLTEKNKTKEFMNKLVPVYHTELDINSDFFNAGNTKKILDYFTTPVCAINKKIVNQIKEKGNSSQLLPVGINDKKFKPFKKINKIKKVGFIGFKDTFEEWSKIKRPKLFDDICKKANVEPIYINGKENNFQMYKDIDLIICTSTVEGNPMAFLECAASKIPFISTKVGIVNEYKEVKTFNTIDEAVELINELNKNKDNIQEYVDKLYNVIIPERKWENVLEKYWMPYFNGLNSGNFDFIEIGTSDFGSLSIDSPNKKGLLVEPIKRYLDNLPNNDNQIKANYAMSDKNDKVKIFYVKPEDIKKHNLPNWVRGCNTINKPHPTIKRRLGDKHDDIVSVDLIECITWKRLIKEFNIKSIGYLKIDTEGHEHIILDEYLKVCEVNPNLLANKILFEYNKLSDNNKMTDIINRFKKLGYNGKHLGEDYELNRNRHI